MACDVASFVANEEPLWIGRGTPLDAVEVRAARHCVLALWGLFPVALPYPCQGTWTDQGALWVVQSMGTGPLAWSLQPIPVPRACPPSLATSSGSERECCLGPARVLAPRS